jgi:hypothetical protein
MDDNQNKIDSCLNQKHLDEYSFGYDCTKAYIQPVPGAPPLLSIGFIDTTGMHHMANTRESSERFLNKVTPNWKELGIDLSRNIQVAEVAKAFYLDKTISQADIQL